MRFSRNETLHFRKTDLPLRLLTRVNKVQETTLASHLVELHSTLSEYDRGEMVLVSDLRTLAVLFVRNGPSFSSFSRA